MRRVRSQTNKLGGLGLGGGARHLLEEIAQLKLWESRAVGVWGPLVHRRWSVKLCQALWVPSPCTAGQRPVSMEGPGLGQGRPEPSGKTLKGLWGLNKGEEAVPTCSGRAGSPVIEEASGRDNLTCQEQGGLRMEQWEHGHPGSQPNLC